MNQLKTKAMIKKVQNLFTVPVWIKIEQTMYQGWSKKIEVSWSMSVISDQSSISKCEMTMGNQSLENCFLRIQILTSAWSIRRASSL